MVALEWNYQSTPRQVMLYVDLKHKQLVGYSQKVYIMLCWYVCWFLSFYQLDLFTYSHKRQLCYEVSKGSEHLKMVFPAPTWTLRPTAGYQSTRKTIQRSGCFSFLLPTKNGEDEQFRGTATCSKAAAVSWLYSASGPLWPLPEQAQSCRETASNTEQISGSPKPCFEIQKVDNEIGNCFYVKGLLRFQFNHFHLLPWYESWMFTFFSLECVGVSRYWGTLCTKRNTHIKLHSKPNTE